MCRKVVLDCELAHDTLDLSVLVVQSQNAGGKAYALGFQMRAA